MATERFTQSVVAQVIEHDDELTAKARALAHRCVDIAQRMLDNGSPQMQLNVIKSIMPAIGRSLTDKGESEEIGELRDQLMALHQLIVGSEVA